MVAHIAGLGRCLFLKEPIFPYWTICFIVQLVTLISKQFFVFQIGPILVVHAKINPPPSLKKKVNYKKNVDFDSSKEASWCTERNAQLFTKNRFWQNEEKPPKNTIFAIFVKEW